jgi:glutathione S-transferase
VIVLRAKKVKFEVTYINLQQRPDWFMEISPRGKVPVLKVNDEVLFESNAIAEYLDEVVEPRLHPEDPIKRARNRAWTDYLPDFTPALSAVYYTKSRKVTAEAIKAAPDALAKLETALKERGNKGPYFNGKKICLVDAGYAPFFQRFMYVDSKLKTGLLEQFPLVKAWADALMASSIVKGSVVDTFYEEFEKNLKRRGFWVAELFEKKAAAAE